MNYNRNGEKSIRGCISSIWSKYKGYGWTWFIIRELDTLEEYYITGEPLFAINVGMYVSCNVVNGKTYKGEQQYKLQSGLAKFYRGRNQLVDYLSSHKGVSKVVATKLYDEYGDDVIEVLKGEKKIITPAVQACYGYNAPCAIPGTPFRPISALGLTAQQEAAVMAVVAQKSFGERLHELLPDLSDKMAKKFIHLVENGKEDSPFLSVYYNDGPRLLADITKKPYDILAKYGMRFKDIDRLVLMNLHWSLEADMRLERVFTHAVKQHKILDVTTGQEVDTKSVYLDLTKDFLGFCNYIQKHYPMVDGFNMNVCYNYLEKILKSNRYLIKESYATDDAAISAYHLYDTEMYQACRILEDYLIDAYEMNVRGYSVYKTFYDDVLARFYAWKKSDAGIDVCGNLNKEQFQALKYALSHRCTFISGGPGRGKTTLVRAIIQSFMTLHGDKSKVILLAPTGRAVQKLHADTSHDECQTLARFLLMNKSNPENNLILKDKSKCKAGVCTLVVVDESSMLNYVAVANLLRLTRDCTMIFLGDVNQLSPIDPGCFLADVQASGILPFQMLVQNMRAKKQALISNNDRILDASLSPRLHYDMDFAFDFTPQLPIAQMDEITLEKAIQYYQDALKTNDMQNVLLLAPNRKGVMGVTSLNAHIQDLINPKRDLPTRLARNIDGDYVESRGVTCNGFFADGTAIRIQDRVMNIKNNAKRSWKRFLDDVRLSEYDTLKNGPNGLIDDVENHEGIFNGDTGIVMRFIPNSKSFGCAVVIVKMDDGRVFTLDALEFNSNFTLAYATTIHKSQGSEAPVVLVALAEQAMYYPDGFLTKNLLYTGTTRAKDGVTIIGSMNVFKRCLVSEQQQSASTLVAKLQRAIA